MESTKIEHARRKQNELQKRAYVDLAVLPLVDLRTLHEGHRTRSPLSLYQIPPTDCSISGTVLGRFAGIRQSGVVPEQHPSNLKSRSMCQMLSNLNEIRQNSIVGGLRRGPWQLRQLLFQLCLHFGSSSGEGILATCQLQ